MKKFILYFAIFIGVVALIVYLLSSKSLNKEIESILSFEDCASAGYALTESSPRQCVTADGRSFTEEIEEPAPMVSTDITYEGVSEDKVVVEYPLPGTVVNHDFTVTGSTRGFNFEASFPLEVLDKDGNRLFIGPAQATIEDWMVDALVPFSINVHIDESYTGPATVVLRRDNASGLPEHDGSMSFQVIIE